MTATTTFNIYKSAIERASKEIFGFKLPLESKGDHGKAKNLLDQMIVEEASLSDRSHLEHFINQWEEANYEKLPDLRGAELFKHLLRQNNLKQSSFPEIGDQSYVSKIIRKRVPLQLSHIKHLSHRFGLPQSAFLD
ncbi:hypothetical protein OH460_07595 [Vibrio sp. Makdt]|uniref:hypothetical protein n=1 Tax=Vibrio sp. Makdt TaxID=2998828 RepID=UPI0022CD5498|nr:hypothetical protein [Vibrio sp. Makdt]MDA0152161.1 hypothetical protein [Vibrio sp. Makdt]